MTYNGATKKHTEEKKKSQTEIKCFGDETISNTQRWPLAPWDSSHILSFALKASWGPALT